METSDAAERRPEKVTVELGADLLDEIKDAVVYLSGPPYRLTIRAFIERAAGEELQGPTRRSTQRWLLPAPGAGVAGGPAGQLTSVSAAAA